MKKMAIASMTAMLAAATVAAGCSTKEGETPKPSGGQSAQPSTSASPQSAARKPGDLPLTNEQAELRIATYDNLYTPKSYAQNLPVFQEIEKRTNVKIKWEVFPSAQAQTVIDTMFAAGSNLPDIVFGANDIAKLNEGGQIHDLKPFIEKFAPNIQKLYKEMPMVRALTTDPNGAILSIPIVALSEDFRPTYLIRQDWLDKVGKKVPTTIDELVDVLKAFRDNDPNGNGQKDEIPLAFPPGFMDFIASSFDTHPRGNFYPDANGRIEYVPITDKYKEYIKFLNMLYTEKLMDPSFATSTNDKFNAMISGSVTGVAIQYMGNLVPFETSSKGQWTGFVFPKGPSGKAYAERVAPISGGAVITKQSKTPQLAVEFIDYIMATEDGKRFANWGMEGTSYKNENGKLSFTDYMLNNKEIPDPLRALGGNWNLPRVQALDTAKILNGEKVSKLNDELKKIMVDAYPASQIPMTKEEKASLNEGWADMETYKSEMVTKFIMGKANFDKDWDTYVSKMKQLGIEGKIKIEQGKYERYSKIMKGN